MSGRKENNVIHCFSNEGSPSRNVCSFFILHNIEKAFLEKSNLLQDVSPDIFRLEHIFLDSLFAIKNIRKFFLEPIGSPRFTQLEVTFWCQISNQFDTINAGKDKLNPSQMRVEISLRVALPIHFKWAPSLFYDKGKGCQKSIFSARHIVDISSNLEKGISMHHRMQHCHI